LPVQHDIARLQVAVYHALVVCRSQAGAKLARNFQRLVPWQHSDAPQQ
jgi:hypothetical protein